MKRGGPLRRLTPLRNRSPMKRGGRMKPAARKYDPESKPARDAVKERSGGLCEVQLRGVCFGVGGNYHHRKNASQGGGYSPAQGLWVCGSGTTGCHGWITEHPEISREMGWSVAEWDDVLTRRLLYRGRWMLLDDTSGPPIDAPGMAA